MSAWPKNTHFHFVGIGGIGMSGIAEILLDQGYMVSGSDLGTSTITQKLAQKGAKIFKGHAASQVEGAHVMVYSSAINPQNPEWQRTIELNIPKYKRGEILARLMHEKKGIAVAGSHGKTTTTSLIATIFHHAKQDPTFIIGGVVANLGSNNAGSGKGEYLIAEADESDGSFLYLKPHLIALTNIDDDHIDHYGSKEKIIEAFKEFSSHLPLEGKLILNLDDECCSRLYQKSNNQHISYGLIRSCDYSATHIQSSAGGTSFTLLHRGVAVGSMQTQMIGSHNVSNALAAIALSHEAGISFLSIAAALPTFTGVGRRMEKIWSSEDFLVLDDYGHHPTEIRATIKAIKDVDARPLIVVFEPHRYTRTQNFWKEFKESFSGVDELYLSPIYAASEAPIEGITSANMIKEMQASGMRAQYLNSLDDMHSILVSKKNSSGVFLTLGAGAISSRIRQMVMSL